MDGIYFCDVAKGKSLKVSVFAPEECSSPKTFGKFPMPLKMDAHSTCSKRFSNKWLNQKTSAG